MLLLSNILGSSPALAAAGVWRSTAIEEKPSRRRCAERSSAHVPRSGHGGTQRTSIALRIGRTRAGRGAI